MLYFLKRLKWRLVWSWRGCVDAWRHEHSFRTWFGRMSCPPGLRLVAVGRRGKGVDLALGVLVLAAELFNTALERAVDHISLDKHPWRDKPRTPEARRSRSRRLRRVWLGLW